MNVNFTRPKPSHDWTEAELDLVKRRLTEGASYSEIASEIRNGVSRNAVIGKAKRMKFLQGQRPAYAGAPKGKPGSKGQSKANVILHRLEGRKKSEKMQALVPVETPSGKITPFRPPKPVLVIVDDVEGIPFLDVTDKTCRWPLWQEPSDEKRCCGEIPYEGSVYCLAHHRRATNHV